jgi:membrane-associated phospholipid phosphatase
MKLWKVVYVTGAVTAAGLIARSVRDGHSTEFDRTVTIAIQRRKGKPFARLMWLASWAGFPPQSRTLPFVFPALFAMAGLPREAMFQLAGWGTSAISFAVKSVMNRPRPFGEEFTIHKANIGGTSFPSGHVINYIGIYGTLAVILSHRLKSAFLRRIVVTFIGLKIALVGPSRIYLGHHWLTDVLTSYLLGSSYVVVLSSLYRRAVRKG